MRDPVEAYFTALRDIHASGAGVAEVSYYGALEQLLTDVGHKLKPKVRAFMQLSNRGAGNPDGGLFTANQYKRSSDAEPLEGQPPARGAIEVKGTADDVFAIASSKQVARYVEHYGLVLVTNLRDFVLVGRGPGGEPRTLESCQLAKNESVFWARVAQPRAYAEQAAEGFTEFLRRVMLHNAPLADPKDVAWFLASYARTARLRLEHRELPALSQLREQLETALGLKFEGERGDHFFRSTLVQTLFYGMFASWVLWTREEASTAAGRGGRFEWETASATLHVPMVSELFYQFSNPAKLGPLGIAEVLDWAEEVLNRVDRDEFFRRFAEEHAVQYFYEPFLEAFDPQLRKELGVWYTPDEVVKYMVARVDWALREELRVADGLADPSVYVLDPCCGTGAYLVEVLRKIDETLAAKGADALTRHDVKRAAMERVIGFEIMPAPFVIAHLQLGLLLQELGVPLSSDVAEHERAAVYLTNALTGWDTEAPNASGKPHRKAHPAQLLFEFEEERDAAAKVKREAPILVVLGNPPYNSYAGTSPAEEEGLVEPYKKGLVREWGIKKFNLDDLYIRFFRLAERQIAEHTGRGVVCFISNFSYTSEVSFVVMRQRLLGEFDSIYIDNLNGDSRETGKLTPEGDPDPSIFSTEKNREGIRIGTAIGLFVRKSEECQRATTVEYRELWGTEKRNRLEEDARGLDPSVYKGVCPVAENRFSLRPWMASEEYLSWPPITELSLSPPLNGPVERRGQALISIDREPLAARVRAYFDPGVSDAEVAALHPSLMMTGNRIVGPAARAKLLATSHFDESRIVRYVFKPMDVRWCYLDNIRPLFSEPSPDLISQSRGGNEFLVTRDAADKVKEGVPFLWSSAVCDYHCLDGEARHFPAELLPEDGGQQHSLLDADEPIENVGVRAKVYLEDIIGDESADSLLLHVLAVGFSRIYLSENRDAIRTDWPRVPLPTSAVVLHDSIMLGRQIAGLLDPDTALSTGFEYSSFGTLSSVNEAPLNPDEKLGLIARWGIAGRGGITMPSTGKLTERDYTDDERTDIAETVESLGMSAEQAIELLGETCYDVYLNDVAYWRCVPASVWCYTIGGYQVIKKWLSYRERALLGRDLRSEEARYVTEMVRRIAALVLMGPELDANYERVKADVWEWGGE